MRQDTRHTGSGKLRCRWLPATKDMVDLLNPQVLGQHHHQIGDAVEHRLDLLALFLQLLVGGLELFDLLLIRQEMRSFLYNINVVFVPDCQWPSGCAISRQRSPLEKNAAISGPVY